MSLQGQIAEGVASEQTFDNSFGQQLFVNPVDPVETQAPYGLYNRPLNPATYIPNSNLMEPNYYYNQTPSELSFGNQEQPYFFPGPSNMETPVAHPSQSMTFLSMSNPSHAGRGGVALGTTEQSYPTTALPPDSFVTPLAGIENSHHDLVSGGIFTQTPLLSRSPSRVALGTPPVIVGQSPLVTNPTDRKQTQGPKRAFLPEEWQGFGHKSPAQPRDDTGSCFTLDRKNADKLNMIIDKGLKEAFKIGYGNGHADFYDHLQNEVKERNTIVGINISQSPNYDIYQIGKRIERYMKDYFDDLERIMPKGEVVDKELVKVKHNIKLQYNELGNAQRRAANKRINKEAQNDQPTKRRRKTCLRGSDDDTGKEKANSQDGEREYVHNGKVYHSVRGADSVRRIDRVCDINETDERDTWGGSSMTPKKPAASANTTMLGKRKASKEILHEEQSKKARVSQPTRYMVDTGQEFHQTSTTSTPPTAQMMPLTQKIDQALLLDHMPSSFPFTCDEAAESGFRRDHGAISADKNVKFEDLLNLSPSFDDNAMFDPSILNIPDALAG